jgi:hypothetical protein
VSRFFAATACKTNVEAAQKALTMVASVDTVGLRTANEVLGDANKEFNKFDRFNSIKTQILDVCNAIIGKYSSGHELNNSATALKTIVEP